MLEEMRPYSNSRYRTEYKSNYSKNSYTSKGILFAPAETGKLSEDKPKHKNQWDDKIKTLRDQRRARGEFFTCGDKYQPGHQCSKSVPLNVVEELLEVLQLSASDIEGDKGNSSEEDTLMHISPGALAGVQSKKSIRLQGECNGKQILLLIDSDSACSFVGAEAVEQLGLNTVTIPTVHLIVADGGRSTVTQAAHEVNWSCQGHKFNTTFRVFCS